MLYSLGRSVVRFWSFGRTFRSFGRTFGRTFGRSVVRSVIRSVVHSVLRLANGTAATFRIELIYIYIYIYIVRNRNIECSFGKITTGNNT